MTKKTTMEAKSRVKYPETFLVRMTTVEKNKLKRAAKGGDKGQGEIIRGLIRTYLP